MRKVELFLTDNLMTDIAEEIGTWEKLWNAIGYLSTWNVTYPTVRIYRDGNSADLIAFYFDSEGKRQYTIGAVWHETHYGFHS